MSAASPQSSSDTALRYNLWRIPPLSLGPTVQPWKTKATVSCRPSNVHYVATYRKLSDAAPYLERRIRGTETRRISEN